MRRNIINIISYCIFLFLEFLFKKVNNKTGNNLLFINTGQIGDLVISSMILENDDLFRENKNVYFLMKEQYYDLFINYNGKVKILTYNYKKYKWNFFYRIKLFKKLISLNIYSSYNVTAARGILNDEITLLSGAKNKFTTCSSFRYLGSRFGKKMNNRYNEILFQSERNEYKKHINLLKNISDKEPFLYNKNSFNISKYSDFLNQKGYECQKYIVISPLASDNSKTWGAGNYKKLCSVLDGKCRIILNGSELERNVLEYISEGLKNTTIETCSLEFLPALIGNAKFFIGNDSGVTHIALKMQIPLIAILYGGYINMFLPFRENEGKFVYIYNNMDCLECDGRCIYDRPLCLTNINLNRVLEEVEKFLQ